MHMDEYQRQSVGSASGRRRSLGSRRAENDVAGGTALWPEKFDTDALRAHQSQRYTSQDWSALYQQEPTQDVGTFFKDEWLKPIHDAPPKYMNIYGGSRLSRSRVMVVTTPCT